MTERYEDDAAGGDPADGAAGAEARDRRADGSAGGEVWQDRAEGAMEAGAADRAARREDRRFSRVLRDRAILQAENATLRARLAAEQAAGMKGRVTGLDADLASVEREVEDAVSQGDAVAIAKAQRKMAEAAAQRTAAFLQQQEADRLAATAALQAQREMRAAEEQGREPPRVTPTTQAWLEANAWHGRDPRMTRQAAVLHEEAVEEGFVPDSPDYWRHIEEGLDARFPGKVARQYAGERSADDGGGQRRAADPAAAARVPAASGAAPVSRATGSPRQVQAARQIVLGPEALDVARSLNLTPQQYAARATVLARQGRVNSTTISGG